MLAQIVASYDGDYVGNFTDNKTGRSFDYKQIKITSLENGFDDLTLGVPLSFDTSGLVRNGVYIFNIFIPKVQKEKSKFRCVSVLPFDSK